MTCRIVDISCIKIANIIYNQCSEWEIITTTYLATIYLEDFLIKLFGSDIYISNFSSTSMAYFKGERRGTPFSQTK